MLAETMNFDYFKDFKTRFKELKSELLKFDNIKGKNLVENQESINYFIRDRNKFIHGLADSEYDQLFIEKTALDGMKIMD